MWLALLLRRFASSDLPPLIEGLENPRVSLFDLVDNHTKHTLLILVEVRWIWKLRDDAVRNLLLMHEASSRYRKLRREVEDIKHHIVFNCGLKRGGEQADNSMNDLRRYLTGIVRNTKAPAIHLNLKHFIVSI
jgi:hypothetical protein